MGLGIMIVGLVLFLGIHTLTIYRDTRAVVVGWLGAGSFKFVYSLISFIGVGLIAWGFSRYRATEWIDVWYPPTALRHLTLLLMLPASILAVASYIRGHIYTKIKHPLLSATKLWAAAHLLANGDLGSIILFGSFLVWAVYDRISMKWRTDPGAPPMAIGGITNDFIAVAVGIVIYLALTFAFHPLVIGVRVVGV